MVKATQPIPVYQPSLAGNEKVYVNECLDSTWISSKGKYLPLFENAFAAYVGARYATAVCNGTVALHLALLALGLGPGDEVIVPTLTYVASANAVTYVGATPVFVDVEPESWQMDPQEVAAKLTPRTRAILVVHLYGHPANMQAIGELARRHGLWVVEDCAEAIGTRFHGQHVGTFGDIATFSFYGNKLITTGEGGMVVTNSAALLERCNHYKGQGLAAERAYWHDVVGYNYRMTNICAAIGLAQLERIDELLAKKLQVAEMYDEALKGVAVMRHRPSYPDILHSYWMYTILVAEARQRDMVRALLWEAGIDTRPTFSPVHTMPMYAQASQRYPNAEWIGARGISLPSYPDLTGKEIAYIAEQLAQALHRAKDPTYSPASG
ncbi:MAG TPA: DegT/DnrJ/EryC1/StrS aminotransferase family protein [Caldilineaceae bacterium]|nr:DegT/DnrJ/EryC1/StrS aminotransferase family protein [Caldilineaceae bacterium]